MQSVLGTAAASTTKSPSWGHSDKRLTGQSSDQQEPLQHLGSGARQRAGQRAGHYGGGEGSMGHRERRARTGGGARGGRGGGGERAS